MELTLLSWTYSQASLSKSGEWQTCATGRTAARLPFMVVLRCVHWSEDGQQGSSGVQRQWEGLGVWDMAVGREARRDMVVSGIFIFIEDRLKLGL